MSDKKTILFFNMAKDFKKNNFSKERARLEPRPKFYSSVDKSNKPASKKPGTDWKVRPDRNESSDRPSREWNNDKSKFGERKEFDRKPLSGGRENFNDRPKRNFNGEKPKFGEKREGSGYEKPKFGERSNFERKPFGGNRDNNEERPKRSFNDEKPKFGERSNFERKPFGGNRDNNEERPKRSFNDEKPKFGERSNFERKPFGGNRDNNEERPKRSFNDEKPKFGERSNFESKLVPNNDEAPRRVFNEEKPVYGDKFAGKPRKRREEKVEHDKGHFEPKFPQSERPKREFVERPREERNIPVKEERKQSEKFQPVIEVAKKVEEPEDMRLNKFVALSGIASRRAAGEIIKNGYILVNDVVVKEPGHRLLPTDVVTHKDKKLVIASSLVYIIMNKPKGYITTMSDELDRKTVMDLIDKDMSERIYPVGRLDRDTSGLLLFTNDGDMAKKMTHPSHRVKKLYHATLDKPISKRDIDSIAQGLELEDGKAVVDGISIIEGSDKREIGIEIHIGKNRIVRRIFEHLGYSVEKLDRVYYGGLTKKDLPRGRYRHLTEREVIMLRHFA
jgi:23S rRNA pseudouridine2605 synthase